MESSASGSASLFDLAAAEPAVWRAGRVALRYSAGSKGAEERKGCRAGSAVCVDLGIISWGFEELVIFGVDVLLPRRRADAESHGIFAM